MTDELSSLVDEHIALLDEARLERDHHKQHAADLGVALSDAQDLNAELLAALRRVRDGLDAMADEGLVAKGSYEYVNKIIEKAESQ